MSGREIRCPSCGGPRELTNPGVLMFVCEFCGRAVYWDEEQVRASGEQAALTEGFTRLYRDATGELEGHGRFTAVGRIRYSFGTGFWDEWYLRFADGTHGWLTEDNHELCLEEQVEAQVPEFGTFDRLTVGNLELFVEETGQAVCVGAEGELPMVVLPGERYDYIDGSSPDGRHSLGIEYDDEDRPSVFVGDWIPARELVIDGEGQRLKPDAPAPLRLRPEHKPRAMKCPKCAAGLSVRDEHARTVVCDHCNAQLALGEAEAKVLGQRAPTHYPFTFAIGDRLVFRGEGYEVAARLVFEEDEQDEGYDDDEDEVADEREYEYVLYSPRAGSLFLDEYDGAFTLSGPVHVRPMVDDVFSLVPGSVVENHDRRRWVLAERGEYRVAYVDGALPWMAKIGDRVEYAAFKDRSSRARYEVERVRGEIESSLGQLLTPGEMNRARGLSPNARPPAAPRAVDSRWLVTMIVVSGLFTLFNGCAALVASGRGHTVLDTTVHQGQLAEEALTPPFVLSSAGLVRLEVEASGLDNAWLAADLALVKGEEVTHVLDADLEYFHGVEGGERWSEGSYDETLYVEVGEPGPHRLLVRARGGRGESELLGPPPASLRIRVLEGVTMPYGFIVAAMVSAVVFFFLAGVQTQRKAGDS